MRLLWPQWLVKLWLRGSAGRQRWCSWQPHCLVGNFFMCSWCCLWCDLAFRSSSLWIIKGFSFGADSCGSQACWEQNEERARFEDNSLGDSHPVFVKPDSFVGGVKGIVFTDHKPFSLLIASLMSLKLKMKNMSEPSVHFYESQTFADLVQVHLICFLLCLQSLSPALVYLLMSLPGLYLKKRKKAARMMLYIYRLLLTHNSTPKPQDRDKSAFF